MDVAAYYQAVASRRQTIMDKCIADQPVFAQHIASHNFLEDFGKMADVIVGKSKDILLQACREYQYSLEAIILGNYRHAFSSLRLSFELFVAAIYFSGHEMKMQLWLVGSDDLKWGTINDKDTGVFSHTFFQAFNPELKPYGKQYLTMAGAVYRECSEYVHGNPGTHEDVTARLSYNRERVRSYHEKVETVRLCVIVAFVTRYIREMSVETRSQFEGIILESLGQYPEIQAIFGAEN